MAQDTIDRITQRIKDGRMRDENKTEVLALLEELRKELADLPEDKREDALSVAGFTELSTHEASKESGDLNLLDTALNGLRESAQEFRESHPKLAQAIDAIATTLSNAGI